MMSAVLILLAALGGAQAQGCEETALEQARSSVMCAYTFLVWSKPVQQRLDADSALPKSFTELGFGRREDIARFQKDLGACVTQRIAPIVKRLRLCPTDRLEWVVSILEFALEQDVLKAPRPKTALEEANQSVLCAYMVTVAPGKRPVDLDSVLRHTFAEAGVTSEEHLWRFQGHLEACVPEQVRSFVSKLRLRLGDHLGSLVSVLEFALLREAR